MLLRLGGRVDAALLLRLGGRVDAALLLRLGRHIVHLPASLFCSVIHCSGNKNSCSVNFKIGHPHSECRMWVS